MPRAFVFFWSIGHSVLKYAHQVRRQYHHGGEDILGGRSWRFHLTLGSPVPMYRYGEKKATLQQLAHVLGPPRQGGHFKTELTSCTYLNWDHVNDIAKKPI